MPNARDPVPLRTSTHGGSSSAEGGKAFKFDGLFGPGATQSEVYDAAASNIVRGVLEGYNGAILAYGQTGSGKTHSMRGPSDDAACWPSEEAGVIPRALAQLLEERERLRNENGDLRSILKQYLDGISVNEDVINAPNPLLVVNHKTNIVTAAAYQRPVASTVVEGSHEMQIGHRSL